MRCGKGPPPPLFSLTISKRRTPSPHRHSYHFRASGKLPLYINPELPIPNTKITPLQKSIFSTLEFLWCERVLPYWCPPLPAQTTGSLTTSSKTSQSQILRKLKCRIGVI